jgi:hypothetical protein
MKSTIAAKRMLKETLDGSKIVEYTLTEEARQGLTVKLPRRIQAYKRTRFDIMMDLIVIATLIDLIVIATLIAVAAASVAFC